MRRTATSPPEEGHEGRARVARLLTGDPAARLLALRRVVAAAFITGIALSHNLWFPTSRTFPRAPLLPSLPAVIVPAFEYLFGGLFVFSLAGLALSSCSTRCYYAALTSLALLVSFDQTRLQPWVYQYLLVLLVIALYGRLGSDGRAARCLPLLQVVVAMYYFWGGVQKLNYSFCHEVVPQLLTPFGNFLTLTESQTSAIGVGMASLEIFVGCGLLLRRTRNFCVGPAVAMHAMLLVLLIAKGLNSVVWPWNAALMLAVPCLFRRSDASARQALAGWWTDNGRVRAALVATVLCAVLPALSFVGWWDMYLSGALYSGNTQVAAVRVDEAVYERLPDKAKRQMFKSGAGEWILPVYEWGMSELNVPPYPEPRVYRQVARDICKSANDKSQVELIIKGRPATLDGGYEVVRMDCSQIDE